MFEEDVDLPYGYPCTACSSLFTTVCCGIAAICWQCENCGHSQVITSVPVPSEEGS